MKSQLHLGLRRHMLFQCFMLWLAVTQYQTLLGMGKRLHGLSFQSLSSAPHDILLEVMAKIERFIILLYDRTSTSTDIDQARRKLFAKRHNMQSIPPTKAALKEHVKRTVYQGGHVWGQMLVWTPELPSPCKWGWSKALLVKGSLWTILDMPTWCRPVQLWTYLLQM